MNTNKFVVVVLVALGVSAALAEDDDSPKYSTEAKAKAESNREEIKQEIQKLGQHEWAGVYCKGDGLGVNMSLIIAPKSGFLFEWHGCLGLYGRNFGSVTNVNGALHLSFTFKSERIGFQGLAEEFVPVQWGARIYLIPADDMIGFCNAVISQAEPRQGMQGRYLLRVGDETK